MTPPKGPQRKKNEPEQKIRMTYSDTLPLQLEEENPAGFATYAVEIMNDRGRSAGLSNQVVIPLAPTIAPPSQVSAEVSADGVRVSWSGGDQPRCSCRADLSLSHRAASGRRRRIHRAE